MERGQNLASEFNNMEVKYEYPVTFKFEKDLSNDEDLPPFGTKIFIDDALEFFNNMFEEEDFETMMMKNMKEMMMRTFQLQ